MIRLRCDHEFAPTIKRRGDVGFDLYAGEDAQLMPQQPLIVKSGVWVDHIEDGYWLQILTKSGSPKKNFFTLAGVVDTQYRGEIGVWLVAMSKAVHINRGDVIAQVTIREAFYPESFVMVNGAVLTHTEDTPRDQDGGLWRGGDSNG